MKNVEATTSTQVMLNFRASGLTIAAWARAKNFNPRIVYLVLRGERKCLRGQSFKIAQELGMK